MTRGLFPTPTATFGSVCRGPALRESGTRSTSRGARRASTRRDRTIPALRYQVAYRSPGAAVGGASEGSVAAWLQLRASVSGRRVTAVTTLFKKAVLAQYQRLFGEPPAVLHGHGHDRSGYELARYLALPDAGFTHSRGRIHGLAVWLPPESDAELVQRVQVAAESIRQLDGAGMHVGRAPLGPRGASTGPLTQTAGRGVALCAGQRRFPRSTSVTGRSPSRRSAVGVRTPACRSRSPFAPTAIRWCTAEWIWRRPKCTDRAVPVGRIRTSNSCSRSRSLVRW